MSSGAVAAALAAPLPLAVPRWSGTIIEPHVAEIMSRRGLTLEELELPYAAEERLARAALPAGLRDAIIALRAEIERRVTALEALEQGHADRLLPPEVISGLGRLLEHRLRRFERRALAAVKRREVDAMRDVATACGALFPDGVRQERALNFIPILARHGPLVLRRMLDRAADHAWSLVEPEMKPATAAHRATPARPGPR
jgi:uncharacterized protein YllA (UPF0747 family)